MTFAVTSRPSAMLCALVCSLGCKSPTFEFDSAVGPVTSGATGSTLTSAGGVGGSSTSSGGAAGANGEVSVSSGGTQGSGGLYATGDEECLNGVDDDADAAADCDDTDCSPYFSCVPSVPEGWQGPVALWEGAGDAPACADAGYYPTGVGALPSRLLAPALPSECPGCSCAPATEVSCPSASLEYFGDEACSVSLGEVSVDDSCTPVNVAHSGDTRPAFARVSAAQTTADQCDPVVDGSILSPPVELEIARACGEPSLAGLGCSASEHCLPRPLAPFAASVCVHTEGESECPAAYPEARPFYYLATSDSRSCRPCRCGLPTCQNSVSDSADAADCDGSSSTSLAPGVCTALVEDDSNDSDTRSVRLGAAAGATCQPGPVEPIGEYVLSGPVTYCCLSL